MYDRPKDTTPARPGKARIMANPSRLICQAIDRGWRGNGLRDVLAIRIAIAWSIAEFFHKLRAVPQVYTGGEGPWPGPALDCPGEDGSSPRQDSARS
jgi:hypothetical protein